MYHSLCYINWKNSCLEAKNFDDKHNGLFESNQAIEILTDMIRGPAYECPFCPAGHSLIELEPNNLCFYSGEKSTVLGRREIAIPSVNKNIAYHAPTLIYHYISEHHYLPPQEFLDALAAFRLDQSFNIDQFELEQEKKLGENYARILSYKDLQSLDAQMTRKW